MITGQAKPLLGMAQWARGVGNGTRGGPAPDNLVVAVGDLVEERRRQRALIKSGQWPGGAVAPW
jgi:hypothetical protein